jgi:hypothetical protein
MYCINMDYSDHEQDIESFNNDDNIIEEEISIPSKTTKGKDFKRKPTAKQLETMRKNLEKGRAKRALKAKTRAKEMEEYEEYLVQEPKLEKRPTKKYVEREQYYYEDETDTGDESESDVEYEIKPKRKGAKSKSKPTKKEAKEQSKIDRMENILMELMTIQKKAHTSKKPQIVRNTVIQVPKPSVSKTDGSLGKLLKLF